MLRWGRKSARRWRSRKRGPSDAIVAFPRFDIPAKPFRFRAGDPLEPGPFGMMQPKRHPVVEPDLILVPLIAVDGHGTRLGRGKGHYDRALARLKKSGAHLVGVGWSRSGSAKRYLATNGIFRSTPLPRQTGSSSSAEGRASGRDESLSTHAGPGIGSSGRSSEPYRHGSS